MFKQSGRKLLDLPRDKITEWLNSFDTVITDCDGVLWIYNKAIDGSVATVNRLQEIGKKVYFCTNNSMKTRKKVLEEATDMGYQITEDAIVSTAHSVAAYLKNRNFQSGVYVIGTKGISKELDAVGIKHSFVGPENLDDEPLLKYVRRQETSTDIYGAVIVGFDDQFSYPKMIKAANYLSDPNVLFIATSLDERFPMPNIDIPGSGSFVRAIEYCVGREAVVIGKPNASFCEWLVIDGLINPARTLMVGHGFATDIVLGYNCGFQTLLIGTDVNTYKEILVRKTSNSLELRKQIPDLYIPTFGDLMQFLEA